MKAKLSLPERPSALFLVAVVDLLVALLVFTTLLPAIGQQAGVMLDPLEVRSGVPRIPRAKRADVAIADGPPPVFYISGMRFSRDALPAELERRRDEDGIEWVVITPGGKVDVQVHHDVIDMVLAAGLIPVTGGVLRREDSE